MCIHVRVCVWVCMWGGGWMCMHLDMRKCVCACVQDEWGQCSVCRMCGCQGGYCFWNVVQMFMNFGSIYWTQLGHN